MTKLKTGKLLVIAAAIYPASARYGLVGTTAVVTATSFVASPVAWYLAADIVEAPLRKLVRPLAYPAVGSAVMAAAVLAVRNASGLSPVFELPVLVATGVAVYAAAMIAIEVRSEYGLEELVRNVGDAL